MTSVPLVSRLIFYVTLGAVGLALIAPRPHAGTPGTAFPVGFASIGAPAAP